MVCVSLKLPGPEENYSLGGATQTSCFFLLSYWGASAPPTAAERDQMEYALIPFLSWSQLLDPYRKFRVIKCLQCQIKRSRSSVRILIQICLIQVITNRLKTLSTQWEVQPKISREQQDHISLSLTDTLMFTNVADNNAINGSRINELISESS